METDIYETTKSYEYSEFSGVGRRGGWPECLLKPGHSPGRQMCRCWVQTCYIDQSKLVIVSGTCSQTGFGKNF